MKIEFTPEIITSFIEEFGYDLTKKMLIETCQVVIEKSLEPYKETPDVNQ